MLIFACRQPAVEREGGSRGDSDPDRRYARCLVLRNQPVTQPDPRCGRCHVFNGTGTDLGLVSGSTVDSLILNDTSALVTANGSLSIAGASMISSGRLDIDSGGRVRMPPRTPAVGTLACQLPDRSGAGSA